MTSISAGRPTAKAASAVAVCFDLDRTEGTATEQDVDDRLGQHDQRRRRRQHQEDGEFQRPVLAVQRRLASRPVRTWRDSSGSSAVLTATPMMP